MCLRHLSNRKMAPLKQYIFEHLSLYIFYYELYHFCLKTERLTGFMHSTMKVADAMFLLF